MFLRLSAVLILINICSSALADQCFNEPALPAFISQINKTTLRVDEKRAALLGACEEIDKPFENFQTTDNRASLFARLNQWNRKLFNGSLNNNFATMDKSEAQRSYKAQLDKIKVLKDSNERIRLTYNLVIDTMGFYDRSLLNVPINKVEDFGKGSQDYSVENIVDRAKKMNSGGICRHHANLLSWSLNYVSNKEFTTETKNGCNATYCHMWVGLSLPIKTAKGVRTEKFDLDSTNHPDFTVLNPRLNGIPKVEQQRMQGLCSKISKCLLDQMFVKPVKKTKSAPVQIPLLEGVN